MKKSKSTLLQKLAFIVWVILLTPSSLLATPDENNPSRTVLVFGDSLSAAYNIQREQGWVSLLQDFVQQKNLPVQIINASISGETTSGGLSRLGPQLNKFAPDIVILELGGNDGLRGFDLQTTRNNLTQMINQSIQNGARVLLAGMHLPPNLGKTYTQRFTEIYAELGETDQVVLMPFLLEGVATHQNLMQADGIHPNANGQPIIMQNVWQYLSPMLTNENR